MTDNKYTFRSHPIMIWAHIKPFLFILLLPLFKAGIQYLVDKEITGVILGESIATVLLFLYAITKQRSFRLILCDNKITIRYGAYLRVESVVDISSLSSVEQLKNPTDYLFNTVTFRINTESGKIKKSDFEFKLSKKDADKLISVISPLKNSVAIKFSPIRVGLMVATTSSVVTGLFIAVPIIRGLGKFIGMGYEQKLFFELNSKIESINTLVPPVINTVTVVFAVLYLVSFVYSFLRFVNFNISAGDDMLEVSAGLFIHRVIRFKPQAVNAICVEQSPVMRLFKRFMLRVDIAGYGHRRGETAVVVPSTVKSAVHHYFDLFFPDVKNNAERIRPYKDNSWRFYSLPCIALCLVIFVSFTVVNITVYFTELVIFITIIAVLVCFYFMTVSQYNFKHSAISFDNTVYARGSKYTYIRSMYCKYNKIGVITITRYPLDREIGTCNVKIAVRSEWADSIVVRHISYKKIIRQIDNLYRIYE